MILPLTNIRQFGGGTGLEKKMICTVLEQLSWREHLNIHHNPMWYLYFTYKKIVTTDFVNAKVRI